MNKCQPFLCFVRKLLFYYKGRTDLISLIYIFIGDKAVHFWSERHCFYKRRHYELKKCIFIFRICRVLLLKKTLRRGKVNSLRDKRLVIAPIRIYYRHYKMHTVNIAYQSAVFSIPQTSFFRHIYISPFNVFSLDYFNIDAFILSLFRAHGIQNHPKVLNAVNNKGYPQKHRQNFIALKRI